MHCTWELVSWVEKAGLGFAGEGGGRETGFRRVCTQQGGLVGLLGGG